MQIVKDNFLDAKNVEIVKKGMQKTVTSPLGTARVLSDLPFSVGEKAAALKQLLIQKSMLCFMLLHPMTIRRFQF